MGKNNSFTKVENSFLSFYMYTARFVKQDFYLSIILTPGPVRPLNTTTVFSTS
jgi:hypothetical protein